MLRPAFTAQELVEDWRLCTKDVFAPRVAQIREEYAGSPEEALLDQNLDRNGTKVLKQLDN